MELNFDSSAYALSPNELREIAAAIEKNAYEDIDARYIDDPTSDIRNTERRRIVAKAKNLGERLARQQLDIQAISETNVLDNIDVWEDFIETITERLDEDNIEAVEEESKRVIVGRALGEGVALLDQCAPLSENAQEFGIAFTMGVLQLGECDPAEAEERIETYRTRLDAQFAAFLESAEEQFERQQANRNQSVTKSDIKSHLEDTGYNAPPEIVNYLTHRASNDPEIATTPGKWINGLDASINDYPVDSLNRFFTG